MNIFEGLVALILVPFALLFRLIGLLIVFAFLASPIIAVVVIVWLLTN